MATALAAGTALGAGTALANNVPIFLDEVGTARAGRSGWSQAAEFVSLVLDSGWCWAALAVGVGWLSGYARPRVPALAGGLALVAATMVYSYLEAWFQDGSAGGWILQFWLVAALVVGLPLGATGAAVRRPGPVGPLAALVVPVGAVVNMIVVPPPADSRMAVPVTLAVGSAAAVAILVAAARAVRTLHSPVPGGGAPAERIAR